MSSQEDGQLLTGVDAVFGTLWNKAISSRPRNSNMRLLSRDFPAGQAAASRCIFVSSLAMRSAISSIADSAAATRPESIPPSETAVM